VPLTLPKGVVSGVGGYATAGHTGIPGKPITASQLGERLHALGIYAMPGRRAALTDLAAKMPAAVLADLLHLSPGTSVRWVHQAGGDWSRYAAELARERVHQT
jgi:hypothetical protein